MHSRFSILQENRVEAPLSWVRLIQLHFLEGELNLALIKRSESLNPRRYRISCNVRVHTRWF